MPLPDSSMPLNPTVEEVPDEELSNNAGTTPNPGMVWPQICIQHDSVLSSHLSTLQTLKEQVSSDLEASQLISAMIERTNKLMLQFEGVKKHIVPRMGRRFDSARPTGDGSDSMHTTTPPKPEDGSGRKRRKRNRFSNTEIESEAESREPLLEVQRLKRKRTDIAIPGADDDVQDAIPVSLETEDISDEVQRRLEIKEEQRRKRDSKPEKRKRERDSLASNTSTSSIGSTKPRKKFKLGHGANR